MKKRSGKSVKAKLGVRVQSRRARTQPNKPVNTVFLVGFMGAGKTSVGRALGERLNWSFEDLDERIERREKRTVAAIFRDSGEIGIPPRRTRRTAGSVERVWRETESSPWAAGRSSKTGMRPC